MNRVVDPLLASRSDGAQAKTASHPSQPWMTSQDIRGLMGPIEKLILEYPGVAVASAFLVGVTIGWLIKRK